MVTFWISIKMAMWLPVGASASSETAEEENSQTVSDDSQGCGSVTVLSPMVLVILLGAVVLRKRIKPLAMAFCTGNQNHKKIL